jgi:exonuclease VII small subunit
MSEGRMSGFLKTKGPMNDQDIEFKEGKLGNGQRTSFGINLVSESIEDVFKHVPANLYSRRQRQANPQANKDESRVKSEHKDKQFPLTDDIQETKITSKSEQLYQQWRKSGLKNFAEPPPFSMVFEESQIKALNELPDYERGPATLRVISQRYQDRQKDLIKLDMTIDAEDRVTNSETTVLACLQLEDFIEDSQRELHKMNTVHMAKFENPLNIYQKDRKRVINHIDSVVEELERSISEVHQTMMNEVYKELDEKLDQTAQDLKIVDDSRGLNQLFEGAAMKQKFAVSQEFDPIMEVSLRNQLSMHDLFLELCHTDKMLTEFEEKNIKSMGKQFNESLNTSSIEMVSKYLAPN